MLVASGRNDGIKLVLLLLKAFRFISTLTLTSNKTTLYPIIILFLWVIAIIIFDMSYFFLYKCINKNLTNNYKNKKLMILRIPCRLIRNKRN